MAEAVYVSFDKMRAEFARVLRKSGFDGESLNQYAQVLAENSLDGIYTHGVNRFARFVKLVYEGFIHANAGPTICTSSGCNRAMGWALGGRAIQCSLRHTKSSQSVETARCWLCWTIKHQSLDERRIVFLEGGSGGFLVPWLDEYDCKHAGMGRGRPSAGE